jgi:hypothetical protein
VLLCLMPTLGCGDEKCDPDQMLVNHMCKARPTPGPDALTGVSDAAVGDAGVVGDVGVVGEAGTIAGAPFGALCADNAECTVTTDYCATPPAPQARFCTRAGCLQDASICPVGWTCKDLSFYDRSLPSICQPPL